MPEMLDISCAAAPGDRLRVVKMRTDDEVGVYHMHNDKRAAATFLTRDKARELFNWLGVYLHGG